MTIPLPNIGKVAQAALRQIQITDLDSLTQFDKINISRLHGIGPKALGILEEHLQANGLDFATNSQTDFKLPFAILGNLNCNNAPKRGIILAYICYFFNRQSHKIQELAQADMQFWDFRQLPVKEYPPSFTWQGLANERISYLYFQSLLSHGKEAAAEVRLCNTRGKESYYQFFVEFASHQPKALIKRVHLYGIEAKGE